MQHIINPILFLVLLTAPMVRADEQKNAATTQPANPLMGRWETVTIAGKSFPPDLGLVWKIDADYITVTDKSGEQMSHNAYAIDTTKSPKTIVMRIAGELDRLGWFEIKGTELRVILTVNKGRPPKSWDDGAVIVFRRMGPQ